MSRNLRVLGAGAVVLIALSLLGCSATETAGANGASGASGATGTAGAAGSDGATGAQGLAGAIGSAGSQGLTGLTGAQGFTGTTGAQGLTGSTGSQGLTGAVGNQGTDGVAGAAGQMGLTGQYGPMGAEGPQGEQGAQGAQGEPGVDGTSPQSSAIYSLYTGPWMNLVAYNSDWEAYTNVVQAFTPEGTYLVTYSGNAAGGPGICQIDGGNTGRGQFFTPFNTTEAMTSFSATAMLTMPSSGIMTVSCAGDAATQVIQVSIAAVPFDSITTGFAAAG